MARPSHAPASATRWSSSARRGSSSRPSRGSGSARSSASSCRHHGRPVRPRRAGRRSYPWLDYVTITDPEAIEPFAELGIILLLFSIGLELSASGGCGRCAGWCSGSARPSCSAGALLIGAGLVAMGDSPVGGGRRSASRWRCPRPRWCCRSSARTSPVGRAALRDAAVRGSGAGADRVPARQRSARRGERHRRAARARCGSARWSIAAMLVAGRFAAAAPVRPGGADQEPRAVPRRSACWS